MRWRWMLTICFVGRRVVRLEEQEVRTLSAEDLLLALCVHASKHAWMRLGWICDIAGVVRSQRIDYGVVREEQLHN